MTEIYHLLSYLEDVRERQSTKHVKAFIARCPGHDDKSPSLSIALTGDGRILLHCFAGCGAGEIMAAVGLSLSDLFTDSDYRKPPGHQRSLYSQKDYENAYLTGQVAEAYIQHGIQPKPSDLQHIERSLKILHHFHNQLTGRQHAQGS